ncbi:23 kDa integral membrane protein [Anastrepha ludens]|uniref:23 kDa integral membrane protein n=1 Tax=Anastrepha ludens TaxID=28586 RepID=UPI0023AEA32C|nr:23 kDa integral membrane protein [Anastrepha ludens]XP_053963717.1 23 kDa integral membrane protein [Anastrepha ludens]XP_053963718.1 23 kDa integral membrane protein [Anastrepha ludens]
MGCTSGVMKFVLNMMNVLLALFGLALIALAALSFNTAPKVYIYYLFVVGAVNFIAAMLGCCGICQEDVCLTTTYAILIALSLASQIVGKIYASDSNAIKEFAAKDVEKTWLEEIKLPGAMNDTQQTYHCCGKIGPDDYFSIGRRAYPASCYPKMVYNQTALWTTGCIKAAEYEFTSIFTYSSSGEWGNLIVTAVMLLFAIYLVIRFRSKQRRYDY